jgi:acetylornithine deacetylase/succinyl-diaminopimelate desuccinylase-like protein
VLRSVYGVEAWKVGMGGTLPISQTFLDLLGAYTVFFSFAVGDENIHGPNEFFRLSRFEEGMTAWARFLERVAEAEALKLH